MSFDETHISGTNPESWSSSWIGVRIFLSEIDIEIRPVNTAGHFGDIFRGKHPKYGVLALKRLRMGAEENPESVRRFRREGETWRTLVHPNVLPFLGMDWLGGSLYLISPFSEHGTVLDYLQRNPNGDRPKFLRDIAAALSFLHSSKIIHGDIKGRNVLLSPHLAAQVCDFGLARFADACTSTSMKGAGSVRWSSPEVLMGLGKSYASDVYAFGMTIVEILSGNLPFSQYTDNVAVLTAVVLRDERPARTPAADGDGTTYDREWDVAEQCWATGIDKRVSIDQAIIKLNTPKERPSTDTGSLSWEHGEVREINKGEELPLNRSDINISPSMELVEDVGHGSQPNVGQPQASYYFQTMNPMQQDGSYDANSNRYSKSEPGVAASRFQPSARVLDRLAKWRIDPSLIEFPQDATEYQGGHATVSRAMLNLSSNHSVNNMGELDVRNDAGQKVVAVRKLKVTAEKDLDRVLGLTLREAGFLVELSHTNIIELEGFVEDVSKGIVWLVFPWEPNGNLRDFITSQDWEIPERVSLINDVAAGVEYLHSQNPPICHGDIKLVNILVNPDCRAVITKFGSARHLTEGDLYPGMEQGGGQRQGGTGPEAMFSTDPTGNAFTFRGPELPNDEPPTTKVDIWALGWIVREVMTKSIPSEDAAKDSVDMRSATPGHIPDSSADPQMSLILQLIGKCWSVDPSQRPTATAFRKTLNWMPMVVPNPHRTTAPTAPDSEVHALQRLLQLGDMHQSQNDYENASKFYTVALHICTDAADTKGRAQTLMRLGRLHLLQGKNEEAVMSYSNAMEISTSIDDRKMKAAGLLGLARAYKSLKDYDKAATFYSDALKISTDINDRKRRATALFGVAGIHRVQGEYSQAILFYIEALRIYTDMGDQQGRASVFWGLAEVHRLRQEYDEAIMFHSGALQIYTDTGSIRGRAYALRGLARVNHDLGRPTDAIDLREQASRIYERW